MVTEIVNERNGPSPAALVELATRFHRLCDLAWDNDQRLIANRIEHANLEPIVLTDHEETAYRDLRDRFIAIWHNDDPLARRQF